MVASLAPKNYIDRHTIKVKNVVIMNLTTEEIIQVSGLSISGGCALFLLANYGTKGSFYSSGQVGIRVSRSFSLLSSHLTRRSVGSFLSQ